MELTSTETILAIANVIFVIIAIFLFVRLRKSGNKNNTGKKQVPELADIANISPGELKPEMFGLKKEDIASLGKPSEAVANAETGRDEKSAFALEDELPEVEEKPAKKESKKKRAAKKRLGEVIEEAIVKETGVQPEKEEKPEKKESKKKKPAKKEPEKAGAIEEKTVEPREKIVIPEKVEFNFEDATPEKEEKPEKEGKKKKKAGLKVKTGAGKEAVKEKKVEEKEEKKPSKKKRERLY